MKIFLFVLLLLFLHREAAEAAGFHVLRLIHEPAAALLAYNIGQDCSAGRRYSTDAAHAEENVKLFFYTDVGFLFKNQKKLVIADYYQGQSGT